MGPLLTLDTHEKLRIACSAGAVTVKCSLDLDLSSTVVAVSSDSWSWQGQQFPYLKACKQRTVYYWAGATFEPVARYSGTLIKLVPTEWGPPTFEIDGIKMLPTARVSPFADAQRKVALIVPRGKVILDTCGGLGYFAAWCLRGQAARILSYEKNPDVIWLRSLNPWSPVGGGALTLTQGDISAQIASMPGESVDAVLHDPPRFGIAGDLYSQIFYDHLARVLRRHGKLFHYTGTPNKVSRGRDLAGEVSKRLRRAGFETEINGDGVLAVKQRAAPRRV
jgi:predicted methyltransferase